MLGALHLQTTEAVEIRKREQRLEATIAELNSELSGKQDELRAASLTEDALVKTLKEKKKRHAAVVQRVEDNNRLLAGSMSRVSF